MASSACWFPKGSFPRDAIRRSRSASQPCRKSRALRKLHLTLHDPVLQAVHPNVKSHGIHLTLGFLAFCKCALIKAYNVGPLQKQSSEGMPASSLRVDSTPL